MGRPEGKTSSLDAKQKQQDPLARRLHELISNTRELADHLGISYQAVSCWKMGQTRPSFENLCEIAEYFNVSTDYLLGMADGARSEEEVRAICVGATGLSAASVNALMKDAELRAFVDALIQVAAKTRVGKE